MVINLKTVETAFKAIRLIDSTLNNQARQDILTANSTNPVFTGLLDYTYNPYYYYPVSPWAMTVIPEGHRAELASRWGEFCGLAISMNSGVLRSAEAQRYCERFLCACTVTEAKYYRRALHGKLVYRLSPLHINQAMPGLIPDFITAKPVPFDRNELAYPVSVERIITGTRLLALVKDGQVRFMKPTGMTIRDDDYGKRCRVLVEALPAPTVLDGVFDGTGTYFVTDLLPYDQFIRQQSPPYAERYRAVSDLRARLLKLGSSTVGTSHNLVCQSGGQLKQAMARSLKQGYHGVWIKRFEDSYFEPNAWMEWTYANSRNS